MTSKEALNKLCDLATPNGECLNYVIGLSGTILKDLERLEQLEKENIELKYIIKAIKDKGDFRLEKETNGEFTYYAMIIDDFYIPIPVETYNLLNEVLE